ncbi:MAG: cytochrome c3 family protein [Bryobacterales bacterium]
MAQCQTCHVGGQFAGLGTACATCHLDDFNATTDPDSRRQFPQTCESCHTTVQWTGANFDHNNTNFPLTGAHTSVAQCQTCHVGGQFAGLGTACATCHLDDFNATTDPDHAAGFPQTCESCHRRCSGPAQTSTTTTRTSR